jgi:peptidyl-prolyl cis-trans isomerase B (cyclophilin B)
MSRRSLAALSAALLLALAGCGDDDSGDDSVKDRGSESDRTHAAQPENPDGVECQYAESGEAVREVDPPAANAAYTGQVPVTIETSEGDIAATLDADAAPCTVNSFTSLASQGYFDGTACHRLTTDASGIFVLQCGDPSETGQGGPGYSFPDELTGSETYGPGTLAMANAGPDTNGSQFFIVYGDSPLDPAYTVFGTIAPEGLAIVQQVAEDGSDEAYGAGSGVPNTPVEIEYVGVD